MAVSRTYLTERRNRSTSSPVTVIAAPTRQRRRRLRTRAASTRRMAGATRGWRPARAPVAQRKPGVLVAVGDDDGVEQALVHPPRRGQHGVAGVPDHGSPGAQPAQQVDLVPALGQARVVAREPVPPEGDVGGGQVTQSAGGGLDAGRSRRTTVAGRSGPTTARPGSGRARRPPPRRDGRGTGRRSGSASRGAGRCRRRSTPRSRRGPPWCPAAAPRRPRGGPRTPPVRRAPAPPPGSRRCCCCRPPPPRTPRRSPGAATR